MVSDGRSTGADAELVATDLAERGIAIDYLVVESSVQVDAAVVALTTPSTADEESTIGAQVTVDSTTAGPATVTVRRDDEIVGSFDVDLSVGLTSFGFTDAPRTTGLFEYSATVDLPGDQIPENNTARNLIDVDGEARILIIEGLSLIHI